MKEFLIGFILSAALVFNVLILLEGLQEFTLWLIHNYPVAAPYIYFGLLGFVLSVVGGVTYKRLIA